MSANFEKIDTSNKKIEKNFLAKKSSFISIPDLHTHLILKNLLNKRKIIY